MLSRPAAAPSAALATAATAAAATAAAAAADLRPLLPPALQAACETLDLPRGSLLFRAGQAPRFMYHVAAGEVNLQRTTRGGDLLVLQRVAQGLVAEASLGAARYHCDGVATLPTQVLRLPLAALRQALQTDTAFAQRWIGHLNQEIRHLRLRCERLGLATVRARLLHLLETEGPPGGWPLPQGLKALARDLGVTHEALYRCVATLEREAVLHRHAGPPLRLALVPVAHPSRHPRPPR